MARYHATVESRSSATETFAGLADALSQRPPGRGTRTAAPARSGGAGKPAGGRP